MCYLINDSYFAEESARSGNGSEKYIHCRQQQRNQRFHKTIEIF